MKITKILLVEDEQQIANTLVRIFQREFGPHVEIATYETADDAFLSLKSEPADLLVTDFHLPHMSGLALITKARELRPDLKIVFMTASPSDEIERDAKKYANIFITKPFKIDEFMRQIRELLRTSQQ